MDNIKNFEPYKILCKQILIPKGTKKVVMDTIFLNSRFCESLLSFVEINNRYCKNKVANIKALERYYHDVIYSIPVFSSFTQIEHNFNNSQEGMESYSCLRNYKNYTYIVPNKSVESDTKYKEVIN